MPDGPKRNDSSSPAKPGGVPPFEPTSQGVEAFLTEILGPGDFTAVAEALDAWVGWTTEGTSTVGISVSGSVGEAQKSFDSLSVLIEGGLVDWLVTPAEDLYLDAERRFAAAHVPEPTPVDSGSLFHVEKRVERIRLRDAGFSRNQLEDTRLFFARIILLPALQGTLSTAELNAHYGRFLWARDEHLGIENHSLLAQAARLCLPLFSNLTDGSILGRQIAAAALTGNRLVVDSSRDLNLAAGLVLAAGRDGGSLVACFGGGPPRDLVLQASRHLGHLLSDQPGHHAAVLEIVQAGRSRLGSLFARLWPEGGPKFRGIELDPSVVLPLLAAFWIQRSTSRPPRRLLEQRDLLLEQLRDDHLRDDLERQVRETGAQLQAGVREAQDQFQHRLEEQRATIQTEVQRLQNQVQSRLHRFLKQVRPATAREDSDKLGTADTSGDSGDVGGSGASDASGGSDDSGGSGNSGVEGGSGGAGGSSDSGDPRASSGSGASGP